MSPSPSSVGSPASAISRSERARLTAVRAKRFYRITSSQINRALHRAIESIARSNRRLPDRPILAHFFFLGAKIPVIPLTTTPYVTPAATAPTRRKPANELAPEYGPPLMARDVRRRVSRPRASVDPPFDRARTKGAIGEKRARSKGAIDEKRDDRAFRSRPRAREGTRTTTEGVRDDARARAVAATRRRGECDRANARAARKRRREIEGGVGRRGRIWNLKINDRTMRAVLASSRTMARPMSSMSSRAAGRVVARKTNARVSRTSVTMKSTVEWTRARRGTATRATNGGNGGGGNGGNGGNGDGFGSSNDGQNGGVRALWAAYLGALEKNPLPTKMATSGVLNALGDLFAQFAFDDAANKGVDWRRAGIFTVLGSFLVGPALHFWYGTLGKIVTAQGSAKAFISLALDQGVFAPTFLCVFLSALFTIDGKPQEIAPKLKQDFASTVTMNWKIWIPFQFLNFRYVPLQLQVAAANVVALLWNTYLSWASHKEVVVVETSSKGKKKKN